MTKKDLYWHLVSKCGIYLPHYQLQLAMIRLKTESLQELEVDEKLKKYNLPGRGAFQNKERQEKYLNKTRRKVLKLHPTTKEVLREYQSLTDAALDSYSYPSNIRTAINRGGKAAGFFWIEG